MSDVVIHPAVDRTVSSDGLHRRESLFGGFHPARGEFPRLSMPLLVLALVVVIAAALMAESLLRMDPASPGTVFSAILGAGAVGVGALPAVVILAGRLGIRRATGASAAPGRE